MEANSNTGTNVKVLIIDDVSALRSFLTRCLKHLGGYDVYHAKDGINALQQMRKLNVDVVFLDIEMPKQNGLETLKEIQKYYPKAFVIMLSCHSSLENVQAAIKNGAQGFIVKPFNTDKIKESLAHYQKYARQSQKPSKPIIDK